MSHKKQPSFTRGQAFIDLIESPKQRSNPNVLPSSSDSPTGKEPEPRRQKTVLANGHGSNTRETEVATPVKSVLNSNITPRSGYRKTRAETASPTSDAAPNSSPRRARPLSSTEKRSVFAEEDTSKDYTHKSPTASVGRSRSGSMHNIGRGSITNSPLGELNSIKPALVSEEIPQFFRAGTVQSTKLSRPNSMSNAPKASAGAYSNSKAGYGRSGRLSAMSSDSSTTEEQRSKFFYADDALEAKSPPIRSEYTPNSNRPILETIYSEHGPNLISPVRASSPLKDEITPPKVSLTKPSPRQHKRLTSGDAAELKVTNFSYHADGQPSRRSSVSSQPNIKYASRARASSTHADGPASPHQPHIAANTRHAEQASMFFPEPQVVSSPELVESPIRSVNGVTYALRSPPLSPTKAQSRLDQMNELATNARRERKVLDLEISNSSLLAINQTLEREMKKIKAELRHCRRLSRGGRPLAPSSRSESAKMPSFSNADDVTESEDYFSSDSEFNNSQDDEDELSNLSTSPSSHSSSQANRSSGVKFKDVKIVPLDLTVQHDLLLSSQKLNQSIKVCLDNSELLLITAKQALKTPINSTDVENIGPKVLTPDEVEDEAIDRRQGLLSPTILNNDGSSNPWEYSLGKNASLDAKPEVANTLNQGALAEEGRDQLLEHINLEDKESNHQRERQNSDDQTLGTESGHLVGRKESHATENNHEEQRDLEAKQILEDIKDVTDTEDAIPILPTNRINEPSPLQELQPIDLPLKKHESKPLQQDTKDHPNSETQEPLVEKISEAKAELGNQSASTDMMPEKDPIEGTTTLGISNSTIDYANTPGNRSSLKALGNYLQSFSIFANGGLRPP